MSAICVHCDSETTISKAYKNVSNEKTRHFRLRHEYVRQLIDEIILVVCIRSNYNLANLFMKGFSRDLIRTKSNGMGLKPLDTSHQ